MQRGEDDRVCMYIEKTRKLDFVYASLLMLFASVYRLGKKAANCILCVRFEEALILFLTESEREIRSSSGKEEWQHT